MEQVLGKIFDVDENEIYISVPVSSVSLTGLTDKQYEQVLVGFKDGRSISPAQQRLAWLLLADIAEWQHGFKSQLTLNDTNCDMKCEFISRSQDQFLLPSFSLSDCDMSLATDYINFLISFILEFDVPTKKSILGLCNDIEHYVIACLLNKKCVICNKHAELHHFDAIGMGRNRDEILQIGMKVISLCREHHTIAHAMGRSWLTQTNHLIPMPLDERIARVYKLTKNNRGV